MAKKELIQVNDELQKNLNIISEMKKDVEEITSLCSQIIVNDESTLNIAQQNLSKASQLAKYIDEKRAEIKKPYFEAGKQVDALAKELSTPLETVIVHIKDQVKQWELKRIELAEKAKKELEAKQKAEAEAAEKDRVRKERITTYLNVTLPAWFKENFAKCTTVQDCDKTIAIIQTGLTPDEKMQEFVSQYVEQKNNYLQLVEVKKQQLMSADEMSAEELELLKAKEEIAKQKDELAAKERQLQAQEEAIKQDKLNKELAEKAAKEQEELAKQEELNKTSKVRKIWKFELVDKSKLCPEWITIDEAAVKAYLADNKDKLESGQIVNGVKFIQDLSINS